MVMNRYSYKFGRERHRKVMSLVVFFIPVFYPVLCSSIFTFVSVLFGSGYLQQSLLDGI